MRTFLQTWFAFIVVLLSSVPSCGAQVLTAGIEHSQQLEPLSQDLRSGKQYAPATKDGEWYLVPTWLVGLWTPLHSYQLNEIDEQTGAEKKVGKVVPHGSAEVFGMQLDSAGGVWSPSITVTKKDADNPALVNCRDNRFLAGDDGTVTFRTLDTAVTIDPDKNSISSVTRVENIRRIHLLSDGVAAADCDIREFDAEGIPVRCSRRIQLIEKTTGFRPVNEVDGRDMKATFAEFLRKTGRANLIPRKV